MSQVNAIQSPADELDGSQQWTFVCSVDAVQPDRGVAALVDGLMIAVFRLAAADGLEEEWCAVSHIDPFSGAPVMARGLVGSVGEPPLVFPIVVSPLHKQRFNLRSGACLDDGATWLDTYPVRVNEGDVEVMTQVTLLQ